MALRIKKVDVEGFEPVEFHEPLFTAFEPLLKLEPEQMGMAVLKMCAYRNGARVFDGEVGMAEGMALMKHMDSAMEVCGLAGEKKDSAQANESSAE